MKKSVKLLSLFLCLTYILTHVLFISVSANGSANGVSSTTSPKYNNALGKLTISEVCGSPDEAGYEYVEVVNISHRALNLKDYVLCRFAFSASDGSWLATGLQQIMGFNNETCTHFASLSLKDVELELIPGEVAVIWLVSAFDKDKNVEDFKTYWASKGFYIANVVRLNAYVISDETATNIASSTNINPAAVSVINAKINQTVLPEQAAGYAVSIIRASEFGKFCDDTATKSNATTTASLHNAADSIVIVYVDGYKVTMMKRILCLILGVILSLFPMTTFVTAEGTSESATTATANGAGPLAITEICATPDDGAYEYVEVINTSETTLNLKDYYLARFAFTNGSGMWEGVGLEQIMGQNNSGVQKLAKLSLANVDMTLESNEVALIWIVSAADKDKTVANFKLYWQSKGFDLTNVKIARLEAYTLSGDTATDISSAVSLHASAGLGFLPDAVMGYSISMIKANKLEETYDGALLKDMVSPLSMGRTAALQNAADSIAIVFTQKEAETGKSHNYFQFVDIEAYASQTAGKANSNGGTGVTQFVLVPYAGIVCGPMTDDGELPLQVYSNMSAGFNPETAKDGRLFLDEGMETLASPGVLIYGQYGQDGFIPAPDAAEGETSTYRVVYTGA